MVRLQINRSAKIFPVTNRLNRRHAKKGTYSAAGRISIFAVYLTRKDQSTVAIDELDKHTHLRKQQTRYTAQQVNRNGPAQQMRLQQPKMVIRLTAAPQDLRLQVYVTHESPFDAQEPQLRLRALLDNVGVHRSGSAFSNQVSQHTHERCAGAFRPTFANEETGAGDVEWLLVRLQQRGNQAVTRSCRECEFSRKVQSQTLFLLPQGTAPMGILSASSQSCRSYNPEMGHEQVHSRFKTPTKDRPLITSDSNPSPEKITI